MNRALNKYYFSGIILLYVCISLSGMCVTPLFDEDEGFLAEAARNMLATKNYLLVVVNQEIRFDKPLLCFWLAALSLKVFGNNELAVRLPSFVFFLLFVYQIYRFCLAEYSKKHAELAVFISFGMLQFQLLSKAAITDNVLNFFLATALFQLYYFLQSYRKRHLFWFYTCLGMAFLTKGPIAYVIPFAVLFSYLLVKKDFVSGLKVLYIPYLLWSFLIFAPWFYLQYQISGSTAFYKFFVEHNFGRFATTMENHGGHLWYYAPVVLVGFIPFLHLLFRNVKLAAQGRSFRQIYLLLWFVFPIVFFSFSKTQLPHYIIYGYAPAIVFISGFIGRRSFIMQYVQIGIILAIFFVVPLLAPYFSAVIPDEYLRSMLSDVAQIFDWKYFLVMLVLLIALFIPVKEKIGFGVLIFTFGATLFMYKYGVLQQGFVKSTGLWLKDKPLNVLMTNHYHPSLSFYAEKDFPITAEPQVGDVIFIKPKDLAERYNTSVVLAGSGLNLIKILPADIP